MQIHELTKKKQIELEEGVFDTIGGAVGKTVSGVKNVGSAIAKPFKDVAQGYQTGRMDQTISMLADKAFRAWQKYVAQLEKSIAVQPAPATAPVAQKDPNDDPPPPPPPSGGAAKADATKDASAPGAPTTPQSADATARGEQNKGFGFNRDTGVAFNSQAEKDAFKAQAGNAPSATTPPATTPNYGTQTGSGAKVTYKQPTGVPNPLAKTLQATSPNMMPPPAKPPATVASTAPGSTNYGRWTKNKTRTTWI
jgi:hypothetical protein